MTLRGVRPRPSMVVIGDVGDAVGASLQATFKQAYFCDDWSDLLGLIDPSELDLIVAGTTENAGVTSARRFADSCHVICFAQAGQLPSESLRLFDDLTASGTAFRLAENIHPLLYPLVHAWAEEIPGVQGRPLFQKHDQGSWRQVKENALLSAELPDAAMAIVATRTIGPAQRGLAWLPGAPRPGEWAVALTQLWADHISGLAKWHEHDEYLTDRERAAKVALEDIQRERQRVLANLAEREIAAQGELVAATTEAANGVRRVLTTQDHELVSATARVLRDMGFIVREMDPDKKPGAPKLEDLRVSPPDDPSWVALVEVRGYDKKSATMNDFKRLDRHARYYRTETGVEPSKRICIVNCQFALPPNSPARHRPFHSDPDAVQELETDGDLVVDTRDLFQLHGLLPVLGAAKARRQLMERAGVFKVQEPRGAELDEIA